MPVPVPVVDLRSTPDPEAALLDWIEERKVRPLRLDERLWDTALLCLADEVAVWYLCQHHLITDGQSFAVLYRYVSECYALELEDRLAEARELPPYEDYLAHERRFRSSPAAEKSAGYWKAKLAGPERTTVSFYGKTPSGRTARTDRLVLDVGRERSDRLRQIAEDPGFKSLSAEQSQHTIWATLLFTALHRITGQSALRVGTPFLGRPTSIFRATVGLFIEIGALDVTVEAGDTFATLARRVQRELLQGMLHARPGVSSAELNRSYGVLLNSVTSRFPPFAGLPVTTDWVHTGYGDREHALRLQVSDFDASGGFRLHFDVSTEVFGETEGGWLLKQFQAVLDRFLEDPTRALGSFDLLDAGERRHQLEEFNATDANYPRDLTVVDLFEEQARATPDAIAVQSGEDSLTYAQLDAVANQIGHLLQGQGVQTGDTVAICARRSIEALTAILGILKAGGAYVPIDPAYPVSRRQMMIDDAEPRVVVISGVDLGQQSVSAPVFDLSQAALDDLPIEPPPADRRPSALAYMIYTSGSTGRPKGTMLSHRGLLNYLWWARDQYQGGEALDFPLYSSLSFDLTITSLFVPLISGGRVVVYDGSPHGDGLEILDVFADDQVDVVKLTPAHLALLREQGIECRRIRRLIVGGENFRTELASDISRSFGREVAIFNEYGPTEAVVGCMIHRYDPATDTGPSVPIGRPAANARIHVLDQYDQPVPPGVVGELVISGDGVAIGYRNQPDLTAERFGDDPTRAGSAVVPHRRPGPVGRGRPPGVPGTRRPPGQDPRSPHRAGRDRSRAAGSPGHPERRGRRRGLRGCGPRADRALRDLRPAVELPGVRLRPVRGVRRLPRLRPLPRAGGPLFPHPAGAPPGPRRGEAPLGRGPAPVHRPGQRRQGQHLHAVPAGARVRCSAAGVYPGQRLYLRGRAGQRTLGLQRPGRRAPRGLDAAHERHLRRQPPATLQRLQWVLQDGLHPQHEPGPRAGDRHHHHRAGAGAALRDAAGRHLRRPRVRSGADRRVGHGGPQGVPPHRRRGLPAAGDGPVPERGDLRRHRVRRLLPLRGRGPGGGVPLSGNRDRMEPAERHRAIHELPDQRRGDLRPQEDPRLPQLRPALQLGRSARPQAPRRGDG